MKINQIIHEAGTGLEIDRSIPGRTIARISGDLAYRTGSPTDKKLPDHHDDYTPWSGKVGASTRDDEEDTFDIDYTGDDGELKEFVTPQAVAQDPGLEREKDVDVIIFGRMPQDFTFLEVIQALESVLPREYPPGSSQNTQGIPYSPAERIGQQIFKHGGAVVTTKPLSTAQKVVKEFQARGIKCRIDASGLGEDITRRGFLQGAGAAAVAGAAGGANAEQLNIEPLMTSTDGTVSIVFVSRPGKSVNGWLALKKRNGKWSPVSNDTAGGIKIDGGKVITVGFDFVNTNPRIGRDEAGAPDYTLANMNGIDYIHPIKTASKQILMNLKEIGGGIVEFNPQQKESVQQGVAEGTAGLPDPQNFDSDNDYRDALDAYGKPQDTDADYENMDETKEKIGNMDADAFDAAISRLKKLAGAGPLRTVYDPARRVYKNVPHAVQPAQQPKKVR